MREDFIDPEFFSIVTDKIGGTVQTNELPCVILDVSQNGWLINSKRKLKIIRALPKPHPISASIILCIGDYNLMGGPYNNLSMSKLQELLDTSDKQNQLADALERIIFPHTYYKTGKSYIMTEIGGLVHYQ